MQRYREALTYLNLAFDAMVLEGDTVAIAMIAHPICAVEQAIHRRSNEIIDKMVSAPSQE